MAVTVEIEGKKVVFDLSVNGGEVQLDVVSVDGETTSTFSKGVLWIDRSGKLNRFSEITDKAGLSLNDRGEIKKGGAF